MALFGIRRFRCVRAPILLAGLAVVLLSGCGAASTPGDGAASPDEGPATAGSSPANPGAIPIVASTNVWGDIASVIGGSRVRVDAFISDPAQDPHSYEASPRAQLAIASARLIIENGGGYDDFMDSMIAASGSKAPVVNAVTVSGVTAPPGGELNEHVWYDFPAVGAVAGQIADRLASIDPAGKATFQKNLAEFRRTLSGMQASVARIKAAHSGEQVAITEPVPLYLLQAAGLVDATPPEFSEAIEEGSDVPARVLVATLALFQDRTVVALVYNAQTSGPQTDQVVGAAKDNGIPTVPVTETVPAGEDYVSWMQSNVSALSAALDR